MINWEIDNDGIVTLTMDDPNQGANTMNALFMESLRETVQRLVAEKNSIKGVVVASAKKTFFAGGDLNDLIRATPDDAPRITETVNAMKADMRALETLGVPVVAAINGAALGGGYEIALACHHRIIADVRGAEIGFPEVKLGLLPGGGGVVRAVRLFGIQSAVMDLLAQGQQYKPADALAKGYVDEVVGSTDELIGKAKEWIKTNPGAKQPYDEPKYKIPGGTPSTPAFAMNLPAFPANLRKQLKGAPMPAPKAILSAAVEGAQVDIDTAFKIETEWFVSLVTGQIAKNMTKAFFFDLQSINKGGSRPDGYEVTQFQKVAVIGAGMMGAGIAYVTARSGAQVVLKDVSLEAAEKGKAYSQKILDKAVSRGKMTAEKRDEVLALITPTDDYADCAGADLVVEAVFESPSLKKDVFAELEKVVAPDALLGSNTSTLPITDLATGVSRPADFIGIHFFSPVDKMPLVEIVVGKETSDAAIAKAVDYTLQIKKTPIVVNDSRGFFTSRVIGTFLNEAVAMVGEGIEPASIEQAGSQAGYPAPPLQLMDELTLTLPLKIAAETRAAVEAEGKEFPDNGSGAVLEKLVNEFDRKGRSSGAGFYEYENGERTRLWPGLREAFQSGSKTIPFEDMVERMLFAEALETVKCFDEGVLRTIPDANIGSIFGIGFPPWTGGVVQYMNQYAGGLKGFVERAQQLAETYGERFAPPQSLVGRAAKGESFE